MVRIYDYTGKYANSEEQGVELYKILREKIIHQYKVVVSFENVQYASKEFLNESFGRIYQHFDPTYLKKHLIVTNIQKDDKETLNSVISVIEEKKKVS